MMFLLLVIAALAAELVNSVDLDDNRRGSWGQGGNLWGQGGNQGGQGRNPWGQGGNWWNQGGNQRRQGGNAWDSGKLVIFAILCRSLYAVE